MSALSFKEKLKKKLLKKTVPLKKPKKNFGVFIRKENTVKVKLRTERKKLLKVNSQKKFEKTQGKIQILERKLFEMMSDKKNPNLIKSISEVPEMKTKPKKKRKTREILNL